MNLLKNKKIKLAFAFTAFSLFVFSNLALPAQVFAGNPNISNPTAALCYKEGEDANTPDAQRVTKKIDVSNDTQSTACTAAGGRVIKGGEASPIGICVTAGNKDFYPITVPLLETTCRAAKGVVFPAGSPLPKFNNTGSTAVTNNGPCVGDKYTEECFIKSEDDCQASDSVQASTDNCGILRYLQMFINILATVMGIVVVGVIVIGGIQYSTSAGDPSAAAAARKKIINAVLALVAFGAMYGFIQWVIPGGVF